MTISTTPRRAAIYCRISRDQAGQGLGVARQEELCRDLADRKGWPVAALYVDNDLSAYSGTVRPEFDRLLSDLEAGSVDGVLVVDQDRLTRTPMELEEFIILADRLAVPLANVSGEIDLSTSDGRFRARIMGAVARQESEKKSERLRRQRDQQARLGFAHGGRRRYGYRSARTEEGSATLDVLAEEAAKIQEAASRYLAGESLRAIATDWNDRDIPTATGTTWRVTTLRTMLTGPHIAGLRVHRGEIVGEADWPAILDRGTWEKIRSAIGDPRRSQAGRPPSYLLTSLLVCGRCGGPLYSSRRKGHRRYQCNVGVDRRGCGRLAVTAEPLEDFVTKAVLSAIAGPVLSEALANTEDGGEEDRKALAELRSLEERLERLATDFYAEEVITRREYLAARSAIEAKVDQIRVAVSKSVRPTVELPEDLEEVRVMWEDADLEWRRRLLEMVVNRIVVNPTPPNGRVFNLERVEIEWRA